MIRLIQRRLIVPRGDTGTFSIPVLAGKDSGDVSIFTIFSPLTHRKIFEKVMENSEGILKMDLTHGDTVNLPVGDYVWDIKFYSDPVFIDEKLVGGTEVDSYYSAFQLPICEIRETGDNLLMADDAPNSKLAPDQINYIEAAITEIRNNMNAAANSATNAETSASAATVSAQAALDSQAATLAYQQAAQTAASNAENSAVIATQKAAQIEADLSNKADRSEIPTLVSQLENDSGYLTQHQDISGKANITDLAAVATSGAYSDLSGTPTNVSTFTNDAGYLTQHQDISGKANSADLATVATSGSYNDLSNKPFIPSAVSDLTDDSGHYTKPAGGIPASDLANGVLDVWSGLTYHTSTMSTDSDSFVLGGATDAPTEINKCLVTSTPDANVIPKFDYQGRLHSTTPEEEWDGSNAVATTQYVDTMITNNMPEVPTNMSELNNDAGYLTSYTETDPTVPSWAKAAQKPSYTAAEVGAPTVQEMNSAISTAIGNINSFDMAVVQELPAQDINTHTIYLVPKTGETNDVYDEYIYINNAWEMIGNTQIDLSGKADKTDTVLDTTLSRGRFHDTTIGTGSFAFGNNVTASGNYSHAEGTQTTASKNSAHAEGTQTIASQNAAHAEGSQTTASGFFSHAEGTSTTASQIAAHAEGVMTTASEQAAHAEGTGTVAGAVNTHAEGGNTTASAVCSHAEGTGTEANAIYMHAQGAYNILDTVYPTWVKNTQYNIGDKIKRPGTDVGYICIEENEDSTWVSTHWEQIDNHYSNSEEKTAFVIGNGTANARSNALRVDWNGNEYIAGNLYVNSNTAATEGTQVATVTDVSAKADKTDTVLNTTLSMGRKANTTIGTNSVALGRDIEASGDYSVATGASTVASGMISLAEGYYTVASAENSHAEGMGSVASGQNAHAEGEQSTASGYNSHTEGALTVASGAQSHAEGKNTIANGENMHALGSYNVAATIFPEWVSGTQYEVDDCVTHDNFGYKCIEANSDSNFSYSKWRRLATNSNTLVVVGNSANWQNRSNAYMLDIDGNERIAGDLYVHANSDSTGGNKVATVSEIPDISTKADKVDTVLDTTLSRGRAINTTVGTGSFAFGNSVEASGNYSHAEGQSIASGDYSHSEGVANRATGIMSHAEGNNTYATGSYSHAEGQSSHANGNRSHAEGGSTANGNASHAEGSGTEANGSSSHAEGIRTTADGLATHVFGGYNIVNNFDCYDEWEPGKEYLLNDVVKITDLQNDTVVAYNCTVPNNNSVFDPTHWSRWQKMKYIEIVGNGDEKIIDYSTYETVKTFSNARALDWQGNEYLNGNIYINCNSDSTGGSKVLSSADFATDLDIQNIINGGVGA